MPATLPQTLYTAAQTRELDRIAIEEYGIPGLCLMERAGAALFDCLRETWPQARRIAVVCGVGNNAGDGYVVARLAHLAGYAVEVLQIGDSSRLKGDALHACEYLRAVGGTLQDFDANVLHDCDVAVDALFGTGLDRALEGAWADAVTALNGVSCPILAVDIPSGLHADTGSMLGCAVHAAVTVTFIGLKQGLFTGAGPEQRGALVFDGLQIPHSVYDAVPPAAIRIDGAFPATLLSPRRRDVHKGDCGHVLIIGGEHGYTGAARLAAHAALRCGAGKVSLATRRAHADGMSLNLPELMSHGIESAAELEPLLELADVVVIGPGLGQGPWAHALMGILHNWEQPMVVDADALNLLARGEFALPPAVLTPHPGEAARLLHCPARAIQNDRFRAVRAVQQRYGGVCVLKGAGTLIAGRDGNLALCSAGNPGMASGGMGDVLSGVIGALLGQGLGLEHAAQAGVCLHAHTADQAAAANGERGLLAGDLMAWLQPGMNVVSKYSSNPFNTKPTQPLHLRSCKKT